MSAIAGILDQIGGLKAAIQAVDGKIQEVAGVLLAERDGLEAQAKALTEVAKSKAEFIPVAQRHTLRGAEYQLVYKPTSKWSDSSLAALAEKYGIPAAELEGCKETGHTWAITKVGKGK